MADLTANPQDLRLADPGIRALFKVENRWQAWMDVEATLAHADELTGKVIHVANGDTITILTLQKQQHRIRIAGIDAPEKAQSFGNRAKQNLHRIAHGKDAIADCPKTDRYGRKVCKVWVQPAEN